MEKDWILDVIADLQSFARQNRLPVLAGQLEETWLLAAAEIASGKTGPHGCRDGAADPADDARAQADGRPPRQGPSGRHH